MNAYKINTFEGGIPIENLDEDLKEHLSDAKIFPSFDEIIVTIPARLNGHHNPSFCMFNISGYRYFHVPSETPDQYNIYSYWEKYRYINSKTGNPIDMKINFNFIRLIFHTEYTPITIPEMNAFIDTVINSYCRYIDRIEENRISVTNEQLWNSLYISKVEVALDFYGGNLGFLHDELNDSLFKKRTKIKGIGRSRKTGFTNKSGHVFVNAMPTYYRGSKKSSTQVRCYVKRRAKGNSPMFCRLEMVFKRKFLRDKKIITPADLKDFDFGEYWKSNFMFFDLDREKILAHRNVKNHPVSGLFKEVIDNLPRNRAYNLIKNTFHNPSRILIKKWDGLNDAILKALDQVGIAFTTANKKAQGAYKTHKRIKYDTIMKILDARDKLLKQGVKPSVRKIKKLAKVSHQTSHNYQYLYAENGKKCSTMLPDK